MNKVFDNFVKYLKKAYPEANEIKITYFQQTTDNDRECYRGEVEFLVDTSVEEYSKAVFRAEIENGKIYYFQEGVSWKRKP